MNSEYIPTEEELTAYVLGECDYEQCEAIETAIRNQAETADLHEAIRETVALSTGLFSGVDEESLSEAQRAELTSAVENVVPLRPKRSVFMRNGLVAAAMVAIMASVVVLNNNNLREEIGLEAKYRLTEDRKELIAKYDALVSGEVREEVEFDNYVSTPDTEMETVLRSEIQKSNNLNDEIDRLRENLISGDLESSQTNSLSLYSLSLEQIADTKKNNSNYQKEIKELRSTLSLGQSLSPEGSSPVPFKHQRHVEGTGISELYMKEQAISKARSNPPAEEPAEWFPEDELPSASAANNFWDTSGGKDDALAVVGGPVPAKPKPKMLAKKPATTQNYSIVGGVKEESVALQVQNGAVAASPAPPASRNVPMRTSRAGESRGAGTQDGFYDRQDLSESVVVDGNLNQLSYDAPQQLANRSEQLNFVAPKVTVDINGDGVPESVEWDYKNNERKQIASAPPQDFYRPVPQPKPITPGTEAYDRIIENKFKRVAQAPLSTFSIDVDTASYSNMRRFLTQGQMPPVDSVRVEELINYFSYDYPQPKGEDPFSSNIEVATAPWNPQHKLVRVGLKGKDIVSEERPASNLVFLLDVSGSMSSHNKLPLVKQSIQMLTKQLTNRDRVAIVVYAGNSGLVLPSTPGNRHQDIISALERLNAGGSTNGGAGIELAYRVASENFIKGGVNRVILATDGDFNVGNTSRGGLVSQIESSAKTGVFLSVLGFGMGNLKDATMENLADKGNGNYAYIDTFHEAKKVLVDQMNGTLYTIAKDVKIQVEFNPNRVQSYRLIGYENRALPNRDFNDDTKDAGEIGAGHTVTALYEIVPKGVSATMPQRGVDNLRYKSVQEEAIAKPQADVAFAQELLTVKLRYKQPDGHTSKLLEFHVEDVNADYNEASKDFKFASAVAVFGMKLRNSPFAQHLSYDQVLKMAEGGLGHDLNGYRTEFTGLVRKAKSMSPQPVYYPEEVIR